MSDTLPTISEPEEVMLARLSKTPAEAYERGFMDGHGRAQRWQPIETAPRDRGRLIGWVEGTVRLIQWGKTSHVPLYGWCLADQGAEDFDLCEPTHWMPLPPPPALLPGVGAQGEDDERQRIA